MDDLVVRSARNNAEWCDVVCRAHGLSPRFGADAWTSERRTPAGFPDAVTLSADTDAPSVLARVDASDGCSVKDSFARLDLRPFGFRVLFAGQWIVGPPAIDGDLAESAAVWDVVDDADEWTAAQIDPVTVGDALRRWIGRG